MFMVQKNNNININYLLITRFDFGFGPFPIENDHNIFDLFVIIILYVKILLDHFISYYIPFSSVSGLFLIIPLPRYSQITSNLSLLYFNLFINDSTSLAAKSNYYFLSSNLYVSY